MKTFEIKTSRSRWTSLLIGVLLLVMLVMLFLPYFNYGDPLSSYAPEAGYKSVLPGKWIISGSDPSKDGYKEIIINDAVNAMTVNTTNVIRVDQLAADEAVSSAVKAYASIKTYVEKADVARKQVNDMQTKIDEIAKFINDFDASMVVADGLSYTYFRSEVDGVEVAVPDGEPAVLDAAAIEAIKADAQKSYDKLQKQVKEANDKYAAVLENFNAVKEAVDNAVHGAKLSYEADASYALVTEDVNEFNKKFDEANPEVRASIVSANEKAVKAYEDATAKYEAANAKTKEAKDKYDAAVKAAAEKYDDKTQAVETAKKEADEALKALKAAYDDAVKASKAVVTEAEDAYKAAITAANEAILAVVTEVSAEEAATDVAAANKQIAAAKAEAEAAVAAAKEALVAVSAAETQKQADLKAQYDADVAAQKAENDAKTAAADAALTEAKNAAATTYAKEKEEYQALKKESDALKKTADALKKAEHANGGKIYETKDVDALVYAKAGTEEKLDNKVYAKLAEEKKKANDGYLLCKDVVKQCTALEKDAKSAADKAEKAVTAYEKEMAKYLPFVAKLDPEKTFDEIKKPSVKADEIPALTAEDYAYDKVHEDVPQIMTTEGKVKYNDKNGKNELTLTFANGKEIVTNFTTDVAYNGVKSLSILGYVGFPYNVTDFSAEMAYKIPDFYINDVVLVPILLMVLSIVGIVFCYLKKDKMSAAFIPVAFAVVGLIGYLTSDMLKLGTKYSVHMIGFAVVLVVAVAHIVLSVKEKKSK